MASPANSPADPGIAIAIADLRKSFGDTHAVDGVSLDIPAGGVFGLLGPNGAGKTTTVRMLATLTRPDAGTASVLGHDVVAEADAVRRKVALTGQFASVDEDLTGHENLVLLGRLQGLGRRRAHARSRELLEAFGILEAGPRQAKTYSGGMRRRLDIAASLITLPRVLFLDEPTTGLDPRSRNQVWQVIRLLAARGTTVLLTTQHLDEADQLADRIAVIDHGQVVAQGTPGELKAAVGRGALTVRVTTPEARSEAARIVADVLGTEAALADEPTTFTAAAADTRQVAQALAALSDAQVGIDTFALGQPTLDEVFLALTGQPAAQEHP